LSPLPARGMTPRFETVSCVLSAKLRFTKCEPEPRFMRVAIGTAARPSPLLRFGHYACQLTLLRTRSFVRQVGLHGHGIDQAWRGFHRDGGSSVCRDGGPGPIGRSKETGALGS